jgi:hypothetical protein
MAATLWVGDKTTTPAQAGQNLILGYLEHIPFFLTAIVYA